MTPAAPKQHCAGSDHRWTAMQTLYVTKRLYTSIYL